MSVHMSVHMSLHMCMHTHVYTHVYTHIYTHIYAHVCMHVHIHVYAISSHMSVVDVCTQEDVFKEVSEVVQSAVDGYKVPPTYCEYTAMPRTFTVSMQQTCHEHSISMQ